MGTFEVVVAAARPLSPSVRELTLEADAPVEFAPGQWINLHLPGDAEELKRSYSVASAPDGSRRLELAVTRVEGGPVSTRLHALAVGARLRASGPYGVFTRAADDPAPALFVATGTGLAPIRSMIGAALAARSSAPMRVLFGVRREEDVLWREELARWEATHPDLRVHVTLSRPDPGWQGRRGWVQEHVRDVLGELDGAAAHVWICGLERMVQAVRALARGELGLDRRRVHQEKFD